MLDLILGFEETLRDEHGAQSLAATVGRSLLEQTMQRRILFPTLGGAQAGMKLAAYPVELPNEAAFKYVTGCCTEEGEREPVVHKGRIGPQGSRFRLEEGFPNWHRNSLPPPVMGSPSFFSSRNCLSSARQELGPDDP